MVRDGSQGHAWSVTSSQALRFVTKHKVLCSKAALLLWRERRRKLRSFGMDSSSQADRTKEHILPDRMNRHALAGSKCVGCSNVALVVCLCCVVLFQLCFNNVFVAFL